MAVRRAMDLAARGDDALLVVALKGSLSWQWMVGGRFIDAEQVAIRTAENIELHGDAPVQELSAYGSLLITAATAAARDDRSAAADFLGSASEVVHRVGCDRIDYRLTEYPTSLDGDTSARDHQAPFTTRRRNLSLPPHRGSPRGRSPGHR